jgi:hypothetical protein
MTAPLNTKPSVFSRLLSKLDIGFQGQALHAWQFRPRIDPNTDRVIYINDPGADSDLPLFSSSKLKVGSVIPKGNMLLGDGADFSMLANAGAADNGKILQFDSTTPTGWKLASAGTVTSVDLAFANFPVAITGNPIATAGTLTITPQAAKGDLIAGTGVNTYGRLTVGADGKFLQAQSGQATGLLWADAVTSVQLAVPAELSLSGGPITTSGTITISKVNQNANLIYAGPASGAAAAPAFRVLGVGDYFNLPQLQGGRITTESGVPVSSSDRTAQGTIYWTPYKHGYIALWDGAKYVAVNQAQVSLSLTGLVASGSNYDVWGTLSGGALVLSLSAAWASDTNRGFTINRDAFGVMSLSTDRTKRWLGSIRGSALNQTTDSRASRYVFNADNRLPRPIKHTDPAATWTYTTATFREMNNNTVEGQSRVGILFADADTMVEYVLNTVASNTNTLVGFLLGLGIDSSTVQTLDAAQAPASSAAGGAAQALTLKYCGHPGFGFHTLRALEQSTAVGTTTWFGTQASYNTGGRGFVEM